ncbi:MAG: type VI secretion system tube protein Hcp [Deltaproteobacteria bacterium]|nr:type VI secretion system tube protein Hcp [Deltaproteobacteria bacterium]
MKMMMFLVSLALLSAAPAMANTFHMQVDGKAQGKFRGEGSGEKNGLITGMHLAFEVKSPRDPASGLPSGKRQYSPIVVTKEWGAASTQLLRALLNNEQLKTVVLNFYKPSPNGSEVLFETWTLTDASISDLKSYVSPTVAGDPYSGKNLEDVSFTFHRLEILNHETKDVVVVDDTHQ